MKNKNLHLLLLLAFLWGPTFLFNKIGVQEIPILTMTWSRVFFATFILYAVLCYQGERLPSWGPIWKHLIIMGLITAAIPFTFFVWGAAYVNVSLAAILMGMTPFCTGLIAHFFLPNEKMTSAKILGLVCGIAGLLCLFTPSLTGKINVSFFGVFLLSIAVMSNALGYVYVRKHLQGVLNPLQATTAQLLCATVCLTPLCFAVDHPLSLPIPSFAAIFAALANAVGGTALAFLVYYRLIRRTNATYAATVNYLLPVIGVILGVIFMNDQLGWNFLSGALFVIIGMLVANGAFQKPKEAALER